MFKMAQIVTGYNPGKAPGWHSGWDLNTKGGAQPQLYAPFDAEVINVNRPNGYGNTVWLKNPTNNEIYQFSHLNNYNVKAGQKITKGFNFGQVGYDGLPHKGSHLHVAAFKGDAYNTLKGSNFSPGFKGALNQFEINKGKEFGFSFFNKGSASAPAAVKTLASSKGNTSLGGMPEFLQNIINNGSKPQIKNIAQEAGFKTIGGKLKLL